MRLGHQRRQPLALRHLAVGEDARLPLDLRLRLLTWSLIGVIFAIALWFWIRPIWRDLEALISERDRHCRGAVILGLNQPLDFLADSFANATNPIVKGFMVGRTLWADASLKWFKGELGDAELINEVARNFAVLVDAWRNRHQALRAAA